MTKTDKQIRVELVRSLIGVDETVRRIVYSLGLGKTRSVKVHYATPSTLGKLEKIVHLVKIDPV